MRANENCTRRYYGDLLLIARVAPMYVQTGGQTAVSDVVC